MKRAKKRTVEERVREIIALQLEVKEKFSLQDKLIDDLNAEFLGSGRTHHGYRE